MIQSMTGYGRAESSFGSKKYVAEIRSLNGKNCDFTIKTQVVPREKEMELRKYISEALIRGNIDLFVRIESSEGGEIREIDKVLFGKYYRSLSELAAENGMKVASEDDLFQMILKMPDVITVAKDEVTQECWEVIFGTIAAATEALTEFRKREGEVLEEDLSTRVNAILSYLEEAESYESQRIESVRERLVPKLQELEIHHDPGRLEQEMIFYIEKLDVNEEKVRLRQHCRYFCETMEQEEYPGRKLGFIAQEMGREINTLGSKSNHAQMQKCVVKMKDELEKIKEQVLNIL